MPKHIAIKRVVTANSITRPNWAQNREVASPRCQSERSREMILAVQMEPFHCHSPERIVNFWNPMSCTGTPRYVERWARLKLNHRNQQAEKRTTLVCVIYIPILPSTEDIWPGRWGIACTTIFLDEHIYRLGSGETEMSEACRLLRETKVILFDTSNGCLYLPLSVVWSIPACCELEHARFPVSYRCLAENVHRLLIGRTLSTMIFSRQSGDV